MVLGRPGAGLAGGSVQLDAGLSVSAAADAIVQVANANMADAVRLISIARGYDPRDFALVAFGGAGALHGAALARELSIPVVIVPPNPGITSAVGCLLVDLQHDLAESCLIAAADADAAQLQGRFETLEAGAAERLAHEGVAAADMVMQRSVDMMYQGQWRSLSVPVGGRIESVESMVAAFHALHQREYNFSREDTPVTLFRLNLKAAGVVPKAQFAAYEQSGAVPVPRARRPVHFDAGEPIDTPVYWRPDLAAGSSMRGPAIIEQLDATTVVPPGVEFKIDKWLNVIMRV